MSSEEYLWRERIAKFLAKHPTAISLSEILTQVPRPSEVSQSVNLVELLTSDPQGRFAVSGEGPTTRARRIYRVDDDEITDQVEEWRCLLADYLSRQATVVGLSDIGSNVTRPSSLPCSIKLLDVLKFDSKNRFVILGEGNNIRAKLNFTLNDEQISSLIVQWRENVSRYLSVQWNPVSLVDIDLHVVRPIFLPDSVTLQHVLETDPLERFSLAGEGPLLRIRRVFRASDSEIAGPVEEWRLGTVRALANASEPIALSDLAMMVLRPISLPASVRLVDVLQVDPLKRFLLSTDDANEVRASLLRDHRASIGLIQDPPLPLDGAGRSLYGNLDSNINSVFDVGISAALPPLASRTSSYSPYLGGKGGNISPKIQYDPASVPSQGTSPSGLSPHAQPFTLPLSAHAQHHSPSPSPTHANANAGMNVRYDSALPLGPPSIGGSNNPYSPKIGPPGRISTRTTSQSSPPLMSWQSDALPPPPPPRRILSHSPPAYRGTAPSVDTYRPPSTGVSPNSSNMSSREMFARRGTGLQSPQQFPPRVTNQNHWSASGTTAYLDINSRSSYGMPMESPQLTPTNQNDIGVGFRSSPRSVVTSFGAVPSEFVCPISGDLMREPVRLSDGFVYDRPSLESWLSRSTVSPRTNQPLTSMHFFPEENLKEAIRCFVQDQPNRVPLSLHVPAPVPHSQSSSYSGGHSPSLTSTTLAGLKATAPLTMNNNYSSLSPSNSVGGRFSQSQSRASSFGEESDFLGPSLLTAGSNSSTAFGATGADFFSFGSVGGEGTLESLNPRLDPTLDSLNVNSHFFQTQPPSASSASYPQRLSADFGGLGFELAGLGSSVVDISAPLGLDSHSDQHSPSSYSQRGGLYGLQSLEQSLSNLPVIDDFLSSSSSSTSPQSSLSSHSFGSLTSGIMSGMTSSRLSVAYSSSATTSANSSVTSSMVYPKDILLKDWLYDVFQSYESSVIESFISKLREDGGFVTVQDLLDAQANNQLSLDLLDKVAGFRVGHFNRLINGLQSLQGFN